VRSTQNPALLDALLAAGSVRRLLRQATTDTNRMRELAPEALKSLARVEGPVTTAATGPLRQAVLAGVHELRQALETLQTGGSGDFLEVLEANSGGDRALAVERLESLARDIVRRLLRMYRHGDVAGPGPAKAA
jgi:hypothetical protein